MKIYQENIQRFHQFYQSDYYKLLKVSDDKLVSSIFETLDQDPDVYDEDLYRQLGNKYGLLSYKNHLRVNIGGVTIRLSADCVCGRKQLVTLNHGIYERWVEDYAKVRGSLDLHFLWPKHSLPTINTYRYTQYLDRIDCCLFDLKQYFDGVETPMKLAYEQAETQLWLSQFNGFRDFITRMQLEQFVNEDGDVFDIATNNETVIKGVMTKAEIRVSLSDYLRHLIDKYAVVSS